jgi:predicted flap endonuclease-1-like 5' DNA nuclease
MIELIEANWPVFLVVLLLGLAVAWFVVKGSRRTTVLRDGSDSGDKPAARNQALIDAPPVAVPQPAPLDPVRQTMTGDDLTRIKGVGPKLVATLAELGVTSFSQIAGWSDADIDRIDAQLGRFEGRIRRDDWVMQAKLLGSGDTAAYEARFGRLEP